MSALVRRVYAGRSGTAMIIQRNSSCSHIKTQKAYIRHTEKGKKIHLLSHEDDLDDNLICSAADL